MKTLSFWKKSFYSGLVFFGTIIVLSVGYAVWNSPYVMTTVGSGSGLTANGWNALVNNINDLNSRWSQVGTPLQIVFQQSTTQIGPSTSAGFIDQGISASITAKSTSSNILVEGSLSATINYSEIGYTIYKQVNGGTWVDIDPSASDNGIVREQSAGSQIITVYIAVNDTAPHTVGDVINYNIRARKIVGTNWYNYGRGSDLKTMKITEIAK